MKNVNEYLFALLCIILASVSSYGQVKVIENGDVGIGTNEPATKLDVRGKADINDGNNSIYIGNGSGANADGINNIAIGKNAGLNNNNNGNVLLGTSAGESNQGIYVISLGTVAGANNTGSNNVHLGRSSGYSNTGDHNNYLGFRSGSSNSGDFNNALGFSSGEYTSGNDNNFFGRSAGAGTIIENDTVYNSGSGNNFIGRSSGEFNTSGSNNSFIGQFAGNSNTTGNENIYIGSSTAKSNNVGIRNTVIGTLAYATNIDGIHNVILGSNAGRQNVNGSRNVLIGYQSGYYESGSDKLYIENTVSDKPLVYGDFSSNELTINGSFKSSYDGGVNSGYNQGSFARFNNSSTGSSSVALSTENSLTASIQGIRTGVGSNGVAVGDLYLNAFNSSGPGSQPGRVVLKNNGNVGIGTVTPKATLDVEGSISNSIKAVTSSYVISDSDYTVLASGNTTITLPTASGIKGVIYIIKNIDSASNTITIQTSSSQEIDGSSTVLLTNQYEKIAIQSDGNNWYIIG